MHFADFPEDFRIESQLVSLLGTTESDKRHLRRAIQSNQGTEIKGIISLQLMTFLRDKIQNLVTNLKYFAAILAISNSEKTIDSVSRDDFKVDPAKNMEQN